jgi:hypothetical protein
MKFELNENEKKAAEEFFREEDLKAVEMQKAVKRNHHDTCYQIMWELGQPYTGAMGGGHEYSFMPTSMGHTIVVKHSITKAEKNITDFSTW